MVAARVLVDAPSDNAAPALSAGKAYSIACAGAAAAAAA